MNLAKAHFEKTAKLAAKLKPEDVYSWFVTDGYFPESYVLPPSFHVEKHPKYGHRYYKYQENSFRPDVHQICNIHFPKSELTDRTFGIINPKIHSDIALEIAANWQLILKSLFGKRRTVYSYSFPIPLNAKAAGTIGKLRAGRMIYEYIEMAENDLVQEAHRYKVLAITDIKNQYPSIYTHSIAWALHGKKYIRAKSNRYNYQLLGNRLDKLFQNINDGCTNGIPIGPAVSDLISELILCAIDEDFSKHVDRLSAFAVRFKDDYRLLCHSEQDARELIGELQAALKNYNLELNESKTTLRTLPEGIFREWRSIYQRLEKLYRPKYTFKKFRDFYLGVLDLDRRFPDTGIIDRFLADLRTKSYTPKFPTSPSDAPKVISLLLLLSERRIKAFPTILGLIEIMKERQDHALYFKMVTNHFTDLIQKLSVKEGTSRYQLSWLIYFMKSNSIPLKKSIIFEDPIVNSIYTSRNKVFPKESDFKLLRSPRTAKKSGPIIQHVDVFRPQ